MPKYRDGITARIGDLVYGKPYNTDRKIAGQIVEILSEERYVQLRGGICR